MYKVFAEKFQVTLCVCIHKLMRCYLPIRANVNKLKHARAEHTHKTQAKRAQPNTQQNIIFWAIHVSRSRQTFGSACVCGCVRRIRKKQVNLICRIVCIYCCAPQCVTKFMIRSHLTGFKCLHVNSYTIGRVDWANFAFRLVSKSP